MPDKPHILLVNDDGIFAPGMDELYRGLEDIARLTVVAPATEMSATAHGITLNDPLRAKEYYKCDELYGISVFGTPVDCVKLALKSLMDTMPDMVVSGINLGSNAGINLLYSGTVGAALEGTMHGIPSVALSLATKSNANFSPVVKFIRKFVEEKQYLQMVNHVCLNVNVPNIPKDTEVKGVRITEQATTPWNDFFEERKSPHNHTYYWLSGKKVNRKLKGNEDEWALQEGYISVTPIHYNMTDYTQIEKLKKMLK